MKTVVFALASVCWIAAAAPRMTAADAMNEAAEQAAALMQREDFIGALRIYNRILAANARDIDALLARAECRSRMGDAVGAEGDLDRALKIDSRHVVALERRSGLRLRQRKWAGCIADCSELVKVRPDSVAGFTMRGWARWQQGDGGGAQEDLDRALALDPASPVAHAYRAMVLQKSGDQAGAIADANLALAVEPNNAIALLARGLASARPEDERAGLDDIEKAIKVEPRNPDAWMARARIGLMTGNFEPALSDVGTAINLNQQDAAPYVLRAQVREEMKDHDAAAEDLDRAIVRAPENMEYRRLKAQLSLKMENYVRAIADADAAIARSDAVAWPFEFRARARAESGDLAGGIADLTHVIKNLSFDDQTLYLRGVLHLRSGDAQAARADLEAARSDDPIIDSEVLHRLALTALAERDFARAEEVFSRAITRNSLLPMAYIGRGLTRRHLGRVDDALADLQTASNKLYDYVSPLWVYITKAEAGREDEARTDLVRQIASWRGRDGRSMALASLLIDRTWEDRLQRLFDELTGVSRDVLRRVKRDMALFGGYRELLAGNFESAATRLHDAREQCLHSEMEFYFLGFDLERIDRQKNDSGPAPAPPVTESTLEN